jgi:hypothetical protein
VVFGCKRVEYDTRSEQSEHGIRDGYSARRRFWDCDVHGEGSVWIHGVRAYDLGFGYVCDGPSSTRAGRNSAGDMDGGREKFERN